MLALTESTIDPTRTQPALHSIEAAFTTSVLHPAVLQAADLGMRTADGIPGGLPGNTGRLPHPAHGGAAQQGAASTDTPALDWFGRASK